MRKKLVHVVCLQEGESRQIFWGFFCFVEEETNDREKDETTQTHKQAELGAKRSNFIDQEN